MSGPITEPELGGGRPVVVLCGGPSVERDVSLRTGRAVGESLTRSGFNVRTFDPPGSLRGLTLRAGEVVFNALHGAYGEDGSVQDELARRGATVVGSSAEASRLTFDKWATRERVREAAGIATADASLSPRDWSQTPCVVKPRRGGSSFGLTLLRDLDGMARAWATAGPEPMVEAFVPGEEWTVACLGTRPLHPVRVRPAGDVFDTRSKYDDPRSRFEPLSDAADPRFVTLRETAQSAAAACGVAGLSRSDFIWTGRGAVFLELNTVPGLTDRSLAPLSAAAAGLPFDELVRSLVPGQDTSTIRPRRPAFGP